MRVSVVEVGNELLLPTRIRVLPRSRPRGGRCWRRPVIGHLTDYFRVGPHCMSDQCAPTGSGLGSGVE